MNENENEDIIECQVCGWEFLNPKGLPPDYPEIGVRLVRAVVVLHMSLRHPHVFASSKTGAEEHVASIEAAWGGGKNDTVKDLALSEHPLEDIDLSMMGGS